MSLLETRPDASTANATIADVKFFEWAFCNVSSTAHLSLESSDSTESRNKTLHLLHQSLSNNLCVTDIAAYLYLVFIYAGIVLLILHVSLAFAWSRIPDRFKPKLENEGGEEEKRGAAEEMEEEEEKEDDEEGREDEEEGRVKAEEVGPIDAESTLHQVDAEFPRSLSPEINRRSLEMQNLSRGEGRSSMKNADLNTNNNDEEGKLEISVMVKSVVEVDTRQRENPEHSYV